MKERAKLYKVQKNRVSHNLSKRLGHGEEKDHADGDSFQDPIKKKKLADGSYQPISTSSQQSMIQPQKPKKW